MLDKLKGENEDHGLEMAPRRADDHRFTLIQKYMSESRWGC